MNTLSTRINIVSAKHFSIHSLTSFSLALFFFVVSNHLLAQDKSKIPSNQTADSLIDQYVQTKGPGIITFDSSNIKQFWVDPSVLSKGNSINILLNNQAKGLFESIPLKIQLANVAISQNCKVEVLTENFDATFTVSAPNHAVISSATQEQDFIQYKVLSSLFHLSDTQDFTFDLRFKSEVNSTLSIKKIILSISDNDLFLSSPGTLSITESNALFKNVSTKEMIEKDLVVTGAETEVLTQNCLLLSDNAISSSFEVKNIGNIPTTIYLGYAPFSKDGRQINNKNIPYNNKNVVLKVVSSSVNSDKILVDSYPEEWAKGCYIALNAKEDLSDFPNFSLLEGRIVDVKKIDDTQTEILLDKPVSAPVSKGTMIRIQSPDAATYIYTNIKNIQPGESFSPSSTLKKDDNFFQYSYTAFPRGTYYVKPLILSRSGKEKNTIQISNWTVSY